MSNQAPSHKPGKAPAETPGEQGYCAHSLKRQYDSNFKVTEAYRNSLPDMQNMSGPAIQGALVPVLQVGVSNFRLPLRYHSPALGQITLETSVSGSVSLSADHKGINMSRLIRTFYEFKDRVFTPELLEEILLRYKEDLGSSRAQLHLSFEYPIPQKSLRSGLTGYQYYRTVFEGHIDDLNRFRKVVQFDYIYSSACPCSMELSEHAREHRSIYCVPHSQRSKARVILEIAKGHALSLEEIQAHCLAALQTETQVMVRREDEQAFAELNGAYPKFVEDAIRELAGEFSTESRISDFQIICAHLESLHSHDAVAIINKGIPGGFPADYYDYKSLLC